MLIRETGLLFDALEHLKQIGFDGEIANFNEWFMRNFCEPYCREATDIATSGEDSSSSEDLPQTTANMVLVSLGFRWNLLLELLLFQGRGSMREVWGELERNMAKVSRSRCIITSERGYIGLAPLKTEKGDELCILQDCGVPVVLRRASQQGQAVGEANEQYTLVGTTYIVGLMNGEASEYVKSGDAVVKMIELH
jgi:hypothetical protein